MRPLRCFCHHLPLGMLDLRCAALLLLGVRGWLDPLSAEPALGAPLPPPALLLLGLGELLGWFGCWVPLLPVLLLGLLVGGWGSGWACVGSAGGIYISIPHYLWVDDQGEFSVYRDHGRI